MFRVREKRSRRVLVLKVIRKRAILEEDVLSQLQREVEVHTRLVHPNIVRMYAYFTDAEQGASLSAGWNISDTPVWIIEWLQHLLA